MKMRSATSATSDPGIDIETLLADGIVGKKGAFSRAFAEAMKEDMMTAFWKAIQRPGGAVGRGPRRWYVEIHPEQFGGFVELATHPWVREMCEDALGPDYQIVELGFDTPFQGAKYQPWHRDFPSPPDTYIDRRITSLAFNLTGVDVTEDMGPFEVAPGTQYMDGRDWKHEMFPPQEIWETIRVAGGEEISLDGRYFLPFGAHHSPWNGSSFADRAAGHGAWCGCPGSGARQASRPHGDERVL